MRKFILLCLMMGGLQVQAQIEHRDSLRSEEMDSLSHLPPSGFIRQEVLEEAQSKVHPYEMKDLSAMYDLPVSHFQPDLEFRRDILHWAGGGLYGENGLEEYYGLGQIRYATALAVQRIGLLTLNGSLQLEKTNFYRNIGNNLTGLVTAEYPLSRNIGVTLFGSAYTSDFFTSRALTAYNYGGFFSFTTNNDKWGIDLGAQRYYDPIHHTWTTTPIAMPYYKFNGAKLGFDFGGLLKSILMNVSENASSHAVKPAPRINPVATPRIRR